MDQILYVWFDWMLPEGEIVGRAADMEIINRIEFGGEGIVTGIDDTVGDRYDLAVNVNEVGTGSKVVVTIEGIWSALCKVGLKSLGHCRFISRSNQMSRSHRTLMSR